jgi:2-keto-3-deoxy-6-phosphogluconate aldolase
MGSKLISKDIIEHENFNELEERTRAALALIQTLK